MTIEHPVHELVAARDPGAVAVAWPGGRLTYGELDRQAALVAARLDRLGAKGCAVAVRMSHGPHQLAASLGVLRAGGYLVWLGGGDTGERGRAVLDDVRPVALLRDGDAADPLADWYGTEIGTVVDVPGTADLGGGDLGSVQHGAVRSDVPVSPDDVVYVAHTSGSTGRPRGVAQRHGVFAEFVTWLAAEFGLGPGARVAQWVAPEHDPSLCEVFATLAAGGTLCPPPDLIRLHPERFLDWLATQEITFLQTVPSFARELLAVMAAGGERPTALRGLVLMGEAVSAGLVNGLRDVLPGVRLTNMYGPTETIAATWFDITGPVFDPVPIGRPIPGREVLLLDANDRPCPPGDTGEIVVRGACVATGYVGGDPRGGAFRPLRGPDDGIRTYRTGDLALRRPDGLLEFRGRKDFQVKLLGNRVELVEVEATLSELDSVAECAVVPLTGADGLVRQLRAYVVPAVAGGGDAREWRTRLRLRFGARLPVRFTTLAGGLPRNVAGKVDRSRLAGAMEETDGAGCER